MPVPGDREHLASNYENPYLDSLPRVSTYTAQEIATLQSRLDKQLGPEFISSRQGPGGSRVHYLAAEKVINLANEVFGFNGWSSAIKNVTVDYCDEDKGRISLGLSVIVRVTLKDGTYHEDVGYGEIKNCNGKGAAYEKARKEAATDAMKRALRNFGNVLGNCLYDKDFITKVTKIKVTPARWGEDKLHRHPDYTPIPVRNEVLEETQTDGATETTKVTREKSSSSLVTTEYDDEYGGNLFEEVDFSHPDEVVVLERGASEKKLQDPKGVHYNTAQARQPVPRVQSMPQARHLGTSNPQSVNHAGSHNVGANQAFARQQMQDRGAQGPNMNVVNGRPQQSGGRLQLPSELPDTMIQQRQPPIQNQPKPHVPIPSPQTHAAISIQEQLAPNLDRAQLQQQHNTAAPLPTHDSPVGFITARAAETVKGPTVIAPNVAVFNPHAESPSIRKTSGVNHNRSGPITRQTFAAAPPINLLGNAQNSPAAIQPTRTNFVNPQADVTRKIGMPGAMQSPMANRSAYKPPGPAGVKRGPDGVVRPPLGDVTNVLQQPQAQGQSSAGELVEGKRQKIGET